MDASTIIFYVFGILAVVGAIGVVSARNVVHSALLLVLSLVMVAGVFFVLQADFLGLVQILIYAGAVAVVVLFGLMLTKVGVETATLDNAQRPLALIAAAVFLGTLVYTIVTTGWLHSSNAIQRVDVYAIGKSLFTTWAIPFEVASLVLLVALIGAVVLATGDKS
ncbi:MAG: NADH-quinone oxidoreductase subunit J [Dehalococcoidia bacterium]|nr:NADH-quinone oxidoreductase subunit J [Dehalococcoidia bacterium]